MFLVFSLAKHEDVVFTMLLSKFVDKYLLSKHLTKATP